MTQKNGVRETPPIPVMSLVPFLVISFGLAWGVLALYIFMADQMNGIFGPLTGNHPLFFLAVYAPAIAAFIIVISRSGIAGWRRYLTRLSYWRCSLYWYLLLVPGIPLIFFGGALWKGSLWTDGFPFSTVPSLVLALLIAVIKGPVEEFGWRGFALPLLQRKIAPIWAALLLGMIWGIWHLPAFLLSGTQQSGWSFLPFFLGTITISVIITALYNASRGSILLAAFMHFQLMNPIWPDAQPYDTCLLSVVAVIIVWHHRHMFFKGENAVVDVIPRGKENSKR